jgi:rhomboid family GlyGly-CTERM serine protease
VSEPGADPLRAVAPAESSSRTWWLLAAALAGGALVAALIESRRLDWQPGLAWTEPWRWWSAAWVHWSAGHRAANVLGSVLVAALGWRARCDRLDSAAWFAAWPLTQLGLALQPGLLHYGGLSGVLHAGVVVAACGLLQRERGPRRTIGAAVLAGVALKVLLEQPWEGPLRQSPGWDIAIAPLAHLSGAMAGFCCAALVWGWRRLRAAAPPG